MKLILVAAIALMAFVPVAEAQTRRGAWRYDEASQSASVWFRKPGGSLKVACVDRRIKVVVRRTEPLGVGETSARPVFLTIDDVQFPPFVWRNEGNNATLTAQDPVEELVEGLQSGRRAKLSLTDREGRQTHHEVSLAGSMRAIGKVLDGCPAA